MELRPGSRILEIRIGSFLRRRGASCIRRADGPAREAHDHQYVFKVINVAVFILRLMSRS